MTHKKKRKYVITDAAVTLGSLNVAKCDNMDRQT